MRGRYLVAAAALVVVAASAAPETGDTGGGDRLSPSDSSRAASQRAVRATVAPRAGDPLALFRVTFRGRARLGVSEGRRRSYGLTLRGPQASGCITMAWRQLDRGRRGSRLTARFDPRDFKGGRWCTGRFRGRVLYQDAYACPARGRCEPPSGFERLSRVVGRFSVRVR